MSKRGSTKEGFAKSKKHIHGEKPHPVYYKKKSRKDDDIEYITLSHQQNIKLNDGREITAIELEDNINPSERGSDKKSHVVPIVYEGKRSSLGKNENSYSFTEKVKTVIDRIFMTAPKEKAPQKNKKKK